MIGVRIGRGGCCCSTVRVYVMLPDASNAAAVIILMMKVVARKGSDGIEDQDTDPVFDQEGLEVLEAGLLGGGGMERGEKEREKERDRIQ